MYLSLTDSNGATAHTSAKSGTLQKVTFADVRLEHSISVAESYTSWDESFQQSLTASAEVSKQEKKSPGKTKISSDFGGSGSGKPENTYHTIADIPQKLRTHTDKLIHSKRGEHAKLNIIFGCIAGLIVGLLLYLILVYSFGYTHIEAAIIFGVTTVIFCIGLALSSLCRCIMALLLPNFLTGKGRAVMFSIILGVIVAGPFNNITYNAKESGRSMSCIVDLIKNQTIFLGRQIAEPFVEMGEYVQKQQEELSFLTRNTDDVVEKVKAQLAEMDKALNSASSTLEHIYQVFSLLMYIQLE